MTDEPKYEFLICDPDKIPQSITRKIYLTYGVGKYNGNHISASDYPPRDSEDFGEELLAMSEITFSLPKSKVNIRGKMLEILKKEKEKILAENHKRLFDIDEKINKLLAIEYQPEEAA